MYETTEQLKRETRLRVWLAEFYPESTKPDWQKIWEDNLICAAVSPLHDRDIYEEDDESHAAGEYKKPHHHVVLRFSGPKSYNQVYDILKLISLNGKCPPPQIPYSDINRAVQYLIHYNHKNKAQYLRSGIISLNGFDVERCFQLNTEQEDQLFDACLSFIIQNNIFEYWELMTKLRDQISSCTDAFADEMLRYVRKHTILFNSLLKSRGFYYNGGK